MQRTLALLAPLLLVTVGCSAHAAVEGKPDGRVTELFGGAANVQAVQSADKVEAYRVTSARLVEGKAPRELDGFVILDGPLDVDRETARELADILMDASIYDWDSAKGCLFQPGMAVRFGADDDNVDVLFCFSCNEIMIFRDGKRVGGEDTDRARPRLIAIAKRLFPKDEDIQSLKSEE